MSALISLLLVTVSLQSGGEKKEYSKDNPDPVIAEIERVGSESKTTVELTVDQHGKVARCVIVASSGSDKLDQSACNIMSEKANFTPKLDPVFKKPVEFLVRQAIVWRLEG